MFKILGTQFRRFNTESAGVAAKETAAKLIPGPTWPNMLALGTGLCAVDVYFNTSKLSAVQNSLEGQLAKESAASTVHHTNAVLSINKVENELHKMAIQVDKVQDELKEIKTLLIDKTTKTA